MEVVTVPVVLINEGIFSRRRLIGGQRGDAVGHEGCAHGPVLKSEGDGGRIFHGEIPYSITGHGKDFGDLAADIAKIVDFMDEIDEDGAASSLSSPRERAREILRRLEQCPGGGDPHQLGQTGSDRFLHKEKR